MPEVPSDAPRETSAVAQLDAVNPVLLIDAAGVVPDCVSLQIATVMMLSTGGVNDAEVPVTFFPPVATVSVVYAGEEASRAIAIYATR